jgi:hypothetical protein
MPSFIASGFVDGAAFLAGGFFAVFFAAFVVDTVTPVSGGR